MIVSVMYAVGPGQTFDLDYYMAKHIPMVNELWGPSGMKPVKVLKGAGTPAGGSAGQHVIALLDFPSLEAFQTAGRAHGKQVMGDIVNFTNAEAAVQFNDVLT